MTISYTKIHDKFSCDGATTQFDFNWPVIEENDLRVSLIDTTSKDETVLSLNADYTVSLDNGGDDGGTVTTNTTYSSDYDLLIQRVTDQNQGTNYVDGDRFPANAHESALDKLTMIVQELWDAIQRAWRVPKGEAGSDLSFSHPDSRKNQMPAFDNDGNPALIPVPEDVVQDKNFAVYYITCTGDYTVSEDDPQVELIDPNGANRNILLPDGPGKDIEFVIVNNAGYTSTYYLEVKLSGDTTNYFTRLYSGTSARFYYDTSNGHWLCIGSGFKSRRQGTNSYTDDYQNVAIGYDSHGVGSGTAIGGQSNGDTQGAVVGRSADGSNYGVAIGSSADGKNYGTAIGFFAVSSKYGSAVGYGAHVQRYGGHAISGDHQAVSYLHREEVIWKGQTTDGTTTEIYLHGESSNRCIVLADSVIGFTINIIGKDGSGNIYHDEVKGTIKRDGSGNTTMVGTSTTNINDESGATWSTSVEADDINEALIVKVTGEASTTVDWGAHAILVDRRV